MLHHHQPLYDVSDGALLTRTIVRHTHLLDLSLALLLAVCICRVQGLALLDLDHLEQQPQRSHASLAASLEHDVSLTKMLARSLTNLLLFLFLTRVRRYSRPSKQLVSRHYIYQSIRALVLARSVALERV